MKKDRFRNQKMNESAQRLAKFEARKAKREAMIKASGREAGCITPEPLLPAERPQKYLSKTGWKTR